MSIKLNTQEYHRNGVGGEGFYTVAFTLTEYNETTELIAVIPSALRDYDLNDGGIPCYIINPANPLTSKWRGDSILSDLLQEDLWEWIDAENDRKFQESIAGYKEAMK